MNSIKKFLIRMCGLHLEKHKESEPTTGVLFGFDPPSGYYFDVQYTEYHRDGAWHVQIKDKVTHKIITSSCELLETHDYTDMKLKKIRRSDKQAIIQAVKNVMQQYDHIQNKNKLAGQYPPKSTS